MTLAHEQWLASMDTVIQSLQASSTQMNGLTANALTAIESIEAACAALRQVVTQAPDVKNGLDTITSGIIGLRDILEQNA